MARYLTHPEVGGALQVAFADVETRRQRAEKRRKLERENKIKQHLAEPPYTVQSARCDEQEVERCHGLARVMHRRCGCRSVTQQQRCDKEPGVEIAKFDGTAASLRDMLEGVRVGVLLREVGSGGGPEEPAYEADNGGRKDEQRQ